MIEEKSRQLEALAGARPKTGVIVEAVLAVWPEHAAYLRRSFAARTPEMLEVTEIAAGAALQLIGPALPRFARDYRWTCDRLREEELFFHREGRYRLATFEDADAEVYSNAEYMSKYVNGLLLTQVLWYNHSATLDMFLKEALGAQKSPFDYLEVGPGHGLMIYFAARSPLSRSLEAWDVSDVSIGETRAALRKLAIEKPVRLAVTDIMKVEAPDRQFDLIVISEVLEHLEAPADALRALRLCLRKTGILFISVPLNSPSPDHLHLLSFPEDVRKLVEGAGFEVGTMKLFPTQGHDVEKAIRNKISISAGVIASLSAGTS